MLLKTKIIDCVLVIALVGLDRQGAIVLSLSCLYVSYLVVRNNRLCLAGHLL